MYYFVYSERCLQSSIRNLLQVINLYLVEAVNKVTNETTAFWDFIAWASVFWCLIYKKY